MRILLVTNTPAGVSGYSNQARVFLPRWQALGHEVAVLPYFGVEGAIHDWRGIPLYPKFREPFGGDVVAAHAAHFQADIVMTLTDSWVYGNPQIWGHHRVVMWAPVDHDPIPPGVVQALRGCERPIAYSRYGEQQMKLAGLDPWYVPHGIETNSHTPGDQAAARAKLGLPQDRFIVGMVCVNRDWGKRKALDKNLQAFAAFHQQHPDALLYLHTDTGMNGGDGLPLGPLLVGLGINDHVHFPPQYQANVIGLDDAYMVDAYRAMNVLLAASIGEGFGIPTVEAQSCGTRVIVGDWCASSELCFDGWKIPKEYAEREWSRQQAWTYDPHIGAIYAALEQAYQAERVPSDKARAGALPYDADLVNERYWRPTFEALADVPSLPARLLTVVRAEEVAA